MTSLELRGLEMHSSRMWRWASVKTTIDFMEDTGLNALIFHQNDLIDALVLPEAYFSDVTSFQRWPIRRSTTMANRAYIERVIETASRSGIDFFLEVKEIWYPDALLNVHPDLRNEEGEVCPSNPFWFEYLNLKVSELLRYLPDIAGIIVSPATRESKVSIAANWCHCASCQAVNPKEWYRKYIDAVNAPLAAAGKTLVVRDFAYTVEAQDAVLDAAAECSSDIVLGLKNVPQDFWPTYPDNARIGHSNGLRQWIEFDVWGQYSGFGVFPCSVLEDLQKRLEYARERGAVGAWYRTDWEICNDASNFNSFNMLMLIGGAMLAADGDTDLDQVYQRWAAHGLYSSLRTESETVAPVVPTDPEAWRHLKDFMVSAWSVIEKALYVDGNVFQLSSKPQYSVENIFYMMTTHANRGEWLPGALDVLELTDENLARILGEKEESVCEVKTLADALSVDELGLPDDFIAETRTMLGLFESYVEVFYHVAHVAFLTRRATTTGDAADVSRAEGALRDFDAFREALETALSGADYPYYVYWMLDVKGLEALYVDAKSQLSELVPSR